MFSLPYLHDYHHLRGYPPSFLYIASCRSFKEVRRRYSKVRSCCLLCCVLLPDGPLDLATMHVDVFGLFLSSGLGPAALAGALFPMQLTDIRADGRRHSCVRCAFRERVTLVRVCGLKYMCLKLLVIYIMMNQIISCALNLVLLHLCCVYKQLIL